MAPAEPADYKVSSEDVLKNKLNKTSATEGSVTSDGSSAQLEEAEQFYRKNGYISDLTSKFALDTYDEDNFDPTMYEQPRPWQQQFTYRSLLAATVLIFVLSFITMRGALAVGQSPPLAVPAGLLTFLFIKAFTWFFNLFKIKQLPFTAQENAVVQTCIVAGSALAWGAGFPSALLGMSKQTYDAMGPSKGNRLQDTVQPNVQHVAPFMPIVAFTGVFMLIGFRKLIIIDFDLPWPSGTAVGVLMNSFHGAHNSRKAMLQVKVMLEWFSVALFWAFFRWFFSGYNGVCGFTNFPFFGLHAKKGSWYYDFQATYIGAGMITPHIVSWSMMFGAVIGWGILWPILGTKAGDWYPLGTVNTSSFGGMYGYQTTAAIALMLGDTVYSLSKVGYISYKKYKMYKATKAAGGDTSAAYDPRLENAEAQKYSIQAFFENPLERRVRLYYFFRDNIPWWFGACGYMVWVVISTVVLPFVWNQIKWYYVIFIYIITPPLTLACAYGAGLTDFNVSYNFSKIAIFCFASALGVEHGGLIVALSLSLVLKCAAAGAVEMLQDFRTGYLTNTSPKAMVFGQLLGSGIGCVLVPLCFYILYAAFPVGVAGSAYPAPYAAVYRGIAVLGVEGFGLLPEHCMELNVMWFMLGVLLNVLRESLHPKYGRWVPFPIAMSLPMYLGTYFTIAYCMGSTARILWRMKMPQSEALYNPAVATGLIVGDGIWSLPAAALSIFGVQPPMCMQWVKSFENNSAFPNGYY